MSKARKAPASAKSDQDYYCYEKPHFDLPPSTMNLRGRNLDPGHNKSSNRPSEEDLVQSFQNQCSIAPKRVTNEKKADEDQSLTIESNEISSNKGAQKSSREIAPITNAMINEMNRILKSKKSPLVQIEDTAVGSQDIRTLEDTSWLNDQIINAYMNLIKLRSEKSPKDFPKVHCFNSHLYTQLCDKGYVSVQRWTRKVDIFDYQILIIPIYLGKHWCLIQIRFPEKIILYYDSLGEKNDSCLNTMKQYLIEEFKDKKNGEFDGSNWELKNVSPEELPQQKNSYDCGVFACTFAEHLTRNSPLNFGQKDMRYFRKKMKYEILTVICVVSFFNATDFYLHVYNFLNFD